MLRIDGIEVTPLYGLSGTLVRTLIGLLCGALLSCLLLRDSVATRLVGGLRGSILVLGKLPASVIAPLQRETKIYSVASLVMCGFVAAVVFHYWRAMFYNLQYPLNTFLMNGPERFCDFYGLFGPWLNLHFNNAGPGMNYFPFTFIILEPFTWLKDPYVAVVPFLIIFLLFLFIYSYTNVRTASAILSLQNTVIYSLISYPVLFTLHTANLEGVSFHLSLPLRPLLSEGQDVSERSISEHGYRNETLPGGFSGPFPLRKEIQGRCLHVSAGGGDDPPSPCHL